MDFQLALVVLRLSSRMVDHEIAGMWENLFGLTVHLGESGCPMSTSIEFS